MITEKYLCYDKYFFIRNKASTVADSSSINFEKKFFIRNKELADWSSIPSVLTKNVIMQKIIVKKIISLTKLPVVRAV